MNMLKGFLAMIGFATALPSPQAANERLDEIAPVAPASSLSIASAPIEWEHGLKTDRVLATRHQNKTMGFNIGFDFPKDTYNADRAEVFDFFEAHGGWLFQGGGYPGATAYVKFKDVTDKESANAKLNEILPALDQLMADMEVGKSIKIEKPSPKYTWPDAEPPDQTDPYWKFNNNYSFNGTQYLKKEISPGRWQWVVDEGAMRRLAERQQRRRELWRALRTRLLTADEMKQVATYGSSINIENMVSYRAGEKANELKAALLAQEAMQREAATSQR